MNDNACPICAAEMLPPNVANCDSCRRDFHLQVRMDVPGIDCGEVWIHDERLHLVFGCRECLTAGLFTPAQQPWGAV